MGTGLNRFEGRMFVEGGILFLVVESDPEAGTARVSGRVDGETQVVDMPIADIARRLAAGNELKLDNLNGPGAEKRVVRRADKWFFTSREGLQGPFGSGTETRLRLTRHILAMQSPGAPPSRRQAARA